jgi:predicted nucleic acid-binding protein
MAVDQRRTGQKVKLVDASVAIQWLVREAGTDKALALPQTGTLIAPDLLWTEVANGLWRKAGKGDIDAATALAVMPVLDAMIDERVSSSQVVCAALALSMDLQHPVYDCVYLVIARNRNIPLVTADQRLINKVQASNLTIRLEPL